MDMMNTNCECCGDLLEIDMENCKIVSNISCQRLDNSIAHYKSNCSVFCVSCNCFFQIKYHYKKWFKEMVCLGK